MTKNFNQSHTSYIPRIIMPIIFIGIAFISLLIPLPGKTLLTESITNVAHVWLFFFLTFATLLLYRANGLISYLFISFTLILFGVVSEQLQPFFDRSSSIYDIIKNVFGVVSGILLHISIANKTLKPLPRFSSSLLALLILGGSLVNPATHLMAAYSLPPLPIIADFENKYSATKIEPYGNTNTDIDLFKTNPNVDLSNALSASVGPSAYSGFRIMEPHENWSGYKYFEFDVFNYQTKAISLMLRIDEKSNVESRTRRFVQLISLSSGYNHIVIPIASMQYPRITSSIVSNAIDINNIKDIYLFLHQPESSVRLYFDNFILSR